MYSYVKNFISYCVPILPLGCHEIWIYTGCWLRMHLQKVKFLQPNVFWKTILFTYSYTKIWHPPPNCCPTLPQGIMSMYTTRWCFQLGFNFSGLIIKRFSIIVHYLNPLKKLPLLFLIRSLKSYKLTDRQMRHADKRKAHVSWKNKTVRKIYFIHFYFIHINVAINLSFINILQECTCNLCKKWHYSVMQLFNTTFLFISRSVIYFPENHR